MLKTAIIAGFLITSTAWAQLTMYTPEPAKNDAVMSIINTYRAELEARWKNPILVRFIKFDSVQATASLPLYVPTFDFYSGLFEALSPEELSIVTCHETGHLMGEITLRQSDSEFLRNFDLSPESEADYWGGKCVLRFVRERDLRTNEPDPRCEILPEEEREHCSYAISLYLSTYSRLFKVELNPEAAQDVVYQRGNGIDFRYATSDCRALTAIHSITGKARPSCWYNPVRP